VNSDCGDLLRAFNEEGVRYLIVGAHAFAVHAEPRLTKDFDVWVEPDAENAGRVWRALVRFGAPLHGVRAEDFAKAGIIFQIGVQPNRIDVLTSITGVRFGTAWKNRVRTRTMGFVVSVLSLADLIRNKKAAGRPQDLLDVQTLELARRRRKKR
jgi:hypothetical protein